MNREQAINQLRSIIREVIREEITQRNLKHDEKSGVTRADLVDPKTGETIGTSAHTTTPTGGVKSFRGHILPKSKRSTTESYTLEEWMGMMEEAGYDLEEVSLSRMVSTRDARLNRATDAGEKADKIEKTPGFKVRDRLIKKADDAREEERFNRDRAERTRQHINSKVNVKEGNVDTKIKKKEWEKQVGAKHLPYTADDMGDETGPKTNSERDARRIWLGRLNNPLKAENDDTPSKEKTPSEDTPKDKPKPGEGRPDLTPYDIAAAEYYRSKGYGPGSYTGD